MLGQFSSAAASAATSAATSAAASAAIGPALRSAEKEARVLRRTVPGPRAPGRSVRTRRPAFNRETASMASMGRSTAPSQVATGSGSVSATTGPARWRLPATSESGSSPDSRLTSVATGPDAARGGAGARRAFGREIASMASMGRSTAPSQVATGSGSVSATTGPARWRLPATSESGSSPDSRLTSVATGPDAARGGAGAWRDWGTFSQPGRWPPGGTLISRSPSRRSTRRRAGSTSSGRNSCAATATSNRSTRLPGSRMSSSSSTLCRRSSRRTRFQNTFCSPLASERRPARATCSRTRRR
jgi:hypothetical protein